MSGRDVNTSFARAVVDEWARSGVRDACIAPGSRSTPLALALADDARIRVHVFVDERSASFCALGIGRATGRPAVALCTSGSAAANFHPAVIEAHHGRVPLILATADRPPELREIGAGQTIDQTKLYGDAVRWFVDLGAPVDVDGAGTWWRSTAARTVAEAISPCGGPVHWNLPFREPLVPTGAELLSVPGRAGDAPWTTNERSTRGASAEVVARVAALAQGTANGVIVAGWGAGATGDVVDEVARVLGWPVLADPLSGLRRGPAVVSTYDALVRSPEFATTHRPELVLRLGAPTTGRGLNEFLRGVPQVIVDADDVWLDPARDVQHRVVAEPDRFLALLVDAFGAPRVDRAWFIRWQNAEQAARAALDAHLDVDDEPFEGRVARDVVDAVPGGAALLVASSMPVRDVESFARPRDDLRIFANRGANGIDGSVSTAIGIALGSNAPVVALLGDLCFLHDSNGLLGAERREVDLTFVIVDNDGGGIFSFLPQAAAAPEHFEPLFGTPHRIDIASLAAVHAIPVTEVARAHEVTPAVEKSVAEGGVRVVHVRTDRTTNVDRHRAAFAAARA
jgi:2-succinyl-5-enolpyruvyl-6-hydroxy-3-cyclohexene-1-carboxylate synthase